MFSNRASKNKYEKTEMLNYTIFNDFEDWFCEMHTNAIKYKFSKGQEKLQEILKKRLIISIEQT